MVTDAVELIGEVEQSCASPLSIVSRSNVTVSLPSSACNTLILVCQLCEVLPDAIANVHYFWLKSFRTAT